MAVERTPVKLHIASRTRKGASNSPVFSPSVAWDAVAMVSAIFHFSSAAHQHQEESQWT